MIITEIVKRPCPYYGLLTEITNSKSNSCVAIFDK